MGPCGVHVQRMNSGHPWSAWIARQGRGSQFLLLAPTAWRWKLFVRLPTSSGPHSTSRQQQSPGEELGRARIGVKDRGLTSKDVPRPCVPAQVILHCARRFWPLGKILGALQSCCAAAGAGADLPGQRRARRVFLGMAFFSKALRGLLFSTSGPQGHRRRLRRRFPGNTGRRAGGARCMMHVAPGSGRDVAPSYNVKV